MSSRRLSWSLLLSLLAGAAGSTHAPSAHAGPPPGVTLGAPVEVAAEHYVTIQGSSPALATNGTDTLACWAGVMCARFSAAGVALDAAAITSTLGQTINGPSGTPLVAWDGKAYVVMAGNQWQTLDPATGALGPIHTVDQPWDPPGYYLEPQILAFGGGEVLAVMNNQGVAEVEIFDESGNGIASFYDKDLSWSSVGAAWSNGVFLVAWRGGGSVMKAVRIAADGTLLDAAPFNVDAAAAASDAGTTGSAYGTPVVAGSSDGFLVAWVDGRRSSSGSFDNDVYGSLVGTDGTVQKGAYCLALNAHSPAAAWDGARWWAAWLSWTGSAAALEPITIDGTIGTATPIAGASTGDSPALAATSSITFVGLANPSAVVEARFTPSGTQLDTPPIPISSYSVPASSPTLAASASGYLVTWLEPSPASPQTQLLAARLGLDGTPQDVPPLVLGSEYSSSVASAGGAYFVATLVGTEAVSVLRVPPSGPPQLSYLVAPGADAGVASLASPSIICSGDRCLVSWMTGGTSEAAAIIDDQGNLLVPPFALPPALATPGPSSFLLTLGTTYPTDSGSDMTLQFDGALGAPVPFANDYPVAAAWGVDRYLVVTAAGDVDRLNPAGHLLEPQTAFASGLPGATPALVWDGRAFLATFGSTAALQGASPAALEIPASGAVSGAGAFSVFDSPSIASPLVASSASGAVLAVALQPKGQTPRLVARTIRVVPDAELDGGVDGGDGGSAGDAGSGETADASIPLDGATDASVAPPDAGALDAGAPDANAFDGAMSAPDGGASHGGSDTPAGGSGCGCRAAGGTGADGGGPAGLGWLGLVAVAFARSQRNRGHRGS